jgi:hypothetical protein
MSNIKMSDTFNGKVKREMYDDESVLSDNVYFLSEDHQLDAMVYAINSHDALTARVAELEAALNHVLKMQTRGYVRFGAEFNKMADEALEDKS